MAAPKSIGTIPDILTLIGRGIHAANEDLEVLDLHTLVNSKGKDLIPRVMAFSGGKVRIRALATIDEASKQVKLFGLGDTSESAAHDQFELDVELDLNIMKPTETQAELVERLTPEDVDALIVERKLGDAASLAKERFVFGAKEEE